jgi:pyruvate dehydrogenase E1 component alpha subunit
MLRTLRLQRAVPLRRTTVAPLVRRSVTTDAASTHADKDAIPEVSCSNYVNGTIQHANWYSVKEDDKPFQVQLSDESFETYELDPPSYTLDTTKKELKQMYYDMVAIR